MTVTNTVTETEHLTPLRSAVEHINWNTLYQQKMALEEVSDMPREKRMTRLARLPPGSKASLHSWNAWGMQQKRKESLIIPSGTKTMNIWITGSIMC